MICRKMWPFKQKINKRKNEVNIMRLANGIIIDAEKTLGALKFSALRRERMVNDEEGKSTGEIKERTYDLRSRGQQMMVQVSIPADAGEKNISAGTQVMLVNPVFDTVTTSTYSGAVVDWYIKADDIIPVSTAMNPVSKGTSKDSGTKKDTGAKN